MPGLSIIVPCLNEEASLPGLVARARTALTHPELATAAPMELVLVDDGSRDNSWHEIERLRRDVPNLRAVRHGERRGIPAAWRSGLDHATGEWICVIDADLQYAPEEIVRLWTELRRTEEVDIVQGARDLSNRPRDLRFVLSRVFCGILNTAFGMSLRDNKSGFFLCRREVLDDLLCSRSRYRHWQCFVMVAAHHRGYRIAQLDTSFSPRGAGRSAFGSVAFGPALAVALDLVTALREYRRVRE